MTEGKLEEAEAQAHASKNIMLNIISVVNESIRGFQYLLEERPEVEDKVNLNMLRPILVR